MTTSDQLLDLVGQALLGPAAGAQPPVYATDGQDRVFRPGDWPAQPDQYPIWKLRVVRESKQSIARSGAPEFIVTTTVRAIGEVSAPADVDDAGAGAAEASLWRLKAQGEAAIINSYPLTASIQQIASVESQLAYTSQSETHLAGVQIDLALEFFQGPEDFAPIESDPLTDLTVDAVNYPPAGLDIPLPQ